MSRPLEPLLLYLFWKYIFVCSKNLIIKSNLALHAILCMTCCTHRWDYSTAANHVTLSAWCALKTHPKTNTSHIPPPPDANMMVRKCSHFFSGVLWKRQFGETTIHERTMGEGVNGLELCRFSGGCATETLRGCFLFSMWTGGNLQIVILLFHSLPLETIQRSLDVSLVKSLLILYLHTWWNFIFSGSNIYYYVPFLFKNFTFALRCLLLIDC